MDDLIIDGVVIEEVGLRGVDIAVSEVSEAAVTNSDIAADLDGVYVLVEGDCSPDPGEIGNTSVLISGNTITGGGGDGRRAARCGSGCGPRSGVGTGGVA